MIKTSHGGTAAQSKYIGLYFLILALLVTPAIVWGQTEFFWEAPVRFSPQQGRFPVSASSENFSVLAWQESTPNRNPAVAASGFINIHMAVKVPGEDWVQRGVVAGPYAYSGSEPSIITMVIDSQDRILIAAASSSAETDILISSDRGQSFTRQAISMGAESAVAPRIFVRADGGYLLFVTRGHDQSLAIHYARSQDGITWTPFQIFVPENELALSFLPTHASVGGRDIVFFQSLVMSVDASTNFQLYYKTSDNGGVTWSTARSFTTFADPVTRQQEPPSDFDNQRPHLTRYGDNLLLVWERRYRINPPQIYGVTIDQNANIIGRVEQVNTEEAYCNNPIGFIYEGTPTVIWFDNRRGNNRIVLAQRGSYAWQNQLLSSAAAESAFARMVNDADGTFIFWQSQQQGASRIYMLSPDWTVQPPRVTAVNFTPGRATRSERATVSWNIPYDTSGILGFSWVWSQDERAVPPREVMVFNTGTTQNLNLNLQATRDGPWYFSIMSHDFAGNWSEPARVRYQLKSTPPPVLTIIEPDLDESGFLTSNTFNMRWEPSSDPFVVGYTWNVQQLSFTGDALPVSLSAPPSRVMLTENTVRFSNHDNGLWAFSVSAIDSAGNIGEPARFVFRTNKFIPYTTVTVIDSQQDEQGNLSIRLMGRGFATGGEISSVVLIDSDNQEYSSSFSVLSDREISGLRFENLTEGEYHIRLNHSVRGTYTSSTPINVDRSVTVKHGDYSRVWRTSWALQSQKLITINPVMILAAVLVLFGMLGTVAAVKGIAGVVTEGMIIKQETIAIITGGFMPLEKKQRVVRIQKKGRGLRFKLASFTIGLVLSVIIMIATPMYLLMTNNLRDTLFQGLYDRSKVLLEGLASSARAYLPQGDQGILELSFLPAQSAALPEANYVTITGFRPGSTHNDHVWATNDPDILSKIDTHEFQPGISRITDSLSPIYPIFFERLNTQAQEEVGDISRTIQELVQEGMTYATMFDSVSQQRLADIQVSIRSLEVRLAERLAEISSEISSQPEFTAENIENERIFIFYKPVMFRQGADDNYFRGLIRLEVSLDTIIDQIYQDQIVLMQTISIVAFAALLIGTLGTLILSSFIIRPIRKLVQHIEVIRDTENKAKLDGVDIKITSGDELAILGNTINDMTHGLVKAALAASDLSIGKEIQKKFIPLDLDREGNKQTSGFKKTPNLNFFGYYEGAKGVSGDYFDYQELAGGRYYAIIKCDVAGKGIPAALIMIQVATMFLNYFKQWKPNAKGMQIQEVVYQINDFIETLAFKGRFAAFTLCLFDSETGIARFCNAGDNIVHLYDESEGKLKTITLPQTPATGVLPNFMIESTGGYNVQTVQIDHGDILLLYTDGIEEGKRIFRDKNYKEMVCTEGPADTLHDTHFCGQGDEELGPERVEAIINAVMAREVYTLHKYHNPEGEEVDLQFDFSTCEGRAEDVIMAMVSVEKMFRIYKDPNAGEDSRVLVDKKIDEFLKNHFLQYRRYCSQTREHPDNEAYIYYTHVKEDEQYDDLTILGIKRK